MLHTLSSSNDSLSQRIMWLLRRIGVPCEIKRYQRTRRRGWRRRTELKAVHARSASRPSSPIGDIRIRNRTAIVDYISAAPARGAIDAGAWQRRVEATTSGWIIGRLAMLPLMMNLLRSRLKEAGTPVHPGANRQRNAQPLLG